MIEIQRENIKSGAPDLIISGNIMDMQIRVKTECFLLNLEDWMGWKTGGVGWVCWPSRKEREQADYCRIE
jgi:hypothetical protein